MVAPLESNKVVLSRGTSNGLIPSTPLGGHSPPNSGPTPSEAWKKAQKKVKKNSTSLRMNNNIPNRIPSSTLVVCFPCMVDSRETSRHHCTTVARRIRSPRRDRRRSLLFINIASPETMRKAPIALDKGQGLESTIWYG